jgi:RimJ/RimL family protein N-acetyltransferase
MQLETPRLRLVPIAPAHLLALLDSVQAFNGQFGYPAADGLREFYTSGEVSPGWLEQLHASKTADPWLHGFAVVHLESRLVIGTAGLKGPPDANGVAEIGYGIVPSFEGRGFATEAAQALIDYICADPRVRIIRAHTRPTPNASTRVLIKCGFFCLGEVVDSEDGPVWRWQRGA